MINSVFVIPFMVLVYNILYMRPEERSEDENSWGNKMQEKALDFSGAKAIGRISENEAARNETADGTRKDDDSPFMTAVRNARKAENEGGFLNNVQGKNLEKAAAAAIPGGKMVVGQVKKFGPFGMILLFVVAAMCVFAGVQSLAPFGLVANGLDQFNNLRTSMNKRSTYFMRFSMDRTRNHPITKRAMIFGPERFKISNSQAKKLKKQNVHYIDSDEFNCRFLVYEDADTGKKYAVAANANEVEKLPKSADIDLDGSGNKTHIDFTDRVKLDDALIDSDNFSRSVDVGTRKVKGHIAGWFDDLSNKLHNRIGSSRNKLKDTPKDATDEDIKKRAKPGGSDQGMDETIKGTTDNDAEELVPPPKSGEEDVPEAVGTGDDSIKKNASEAEINSALGGRVKAVTAAVGRGVDIYCTVMKSYAMLATMVSGVMVANIINYITGFLEAVQKTQIGDAGKNELSYYMSGLSKKGKTTDKDGKVVEGKENTSSLESPAWNQFFASGDLKVSSSDKVAEKFNRDEAFNIALSDGFGGAGSIINNLASGTYKIVSTIGNGIAAYRNCLTAQMIQAGADIASSLVLAFFTLGVGAFIKDAVGKLFKQAVLGAIQMGIMQGLMALLPYLAQWMAKDLISNMAGEDAAYAINSGFNLYSGKQMQMSSGLPATEGKLMAHWHEQQEVIAKEGALERSLKSPFDPTSKYTFIGSIVNTMMPVANTFSSPLTTVSKTMNTVGSALAGLMPTARADGAIKFQTSLNKKCPTLSSIGLVGDAYCNPYFVTDFSTMHEDPAEVFDKVAKEDNFNFDNVNDETHNGNPEIKQNSELGKWVVSCAVRDSQFGQVDSNVINAIASLVNTGNSTIDTVVSSGLQMIPIVGSVVDLSEAAKQQDNLEWASGENCMKEKYKYYSRYSEDQRMMESAGIIEKSAVSKLLEDYYKKNPIDNSYEGIIARYSGHTKEDVIATLDTVKFAEWLANYRPNEYGPLEHMKEKKTDYNYESKQLIYSHHENIVSKEIIYNDVRNRTFSV